MNIKFQSDNLKGRDHLEDFRSRRKDNIRRDIKEIR